MTFSERAVEAAARAICLEQFGNEIVHGEARCCQVGGTEGCCVEAVREQAEKALTAALAMDGLALVPATGRTTLPALIPDRNSASGYRVEHLSIEVDAELAAALTAASDGEVG